MIKLLTILFCVSAGAAELPPAFIKAIHQVETSGRYGAIKGDKGKALGPLQIHHSYWKDSKVKGIYSNCTNYNYSVAVMTGYLNRYGSNFIARGDWESLARIHNGGPSGHKRKSTIPYLTKFRKHFKLN